MYTYTYIHILMNEQGIGHSKNSCLQHGICMCIYIYIDR